MTNEVSLIKPALIGLKIRKYDEITIKSSLAVIVEKIFTLAGQNPEKKDIAVICRELASDLRKRYGGMTLAEVDYALNAGVRGDYGEYYGINVVSINKWLKTYYNSDERREAQRSVVFPDLALPQKTVPTKAELCAIETAAYDDALKLAKSGKYVPDRGNVVYDFLDKRGEIHFTDAEKHAFMRQAQSELQSEARREARNAVQSVGYFLDRITTTGVIMRAKRIALNEHLMRILKNERG
jgi:hypothetical protein